jgi:hypothetical protein
MQLAITFLTVVAGLTFSIAVALVVEELIFGQVFRVFFNQRPAPPDVPTALALQPVGIKSRRR